MQKIKAKIKEIKTMHLYFALLLTIGIIINYR